MNSTFVGREKELETLGQHLEAALGGQPRFCFVTGEAGAGKSTLIDAFTQQSQQRHSDLVVVTGACNAHTGQSDPYLPFLSLLTQLTGDVSAQVRQGLTTNENARRLQSLMRFSVKALVDFAPQLIGTFVPGSSLLVGAAKYLTEAGLADKVKSRLEETRNPGAPGELNQERICQQYTELLVQLARQCPLVLIVDDMHWIDSASVDLFFHLSRKLEQSRILVIGCYRPNDVSLGRGGDRHPLDPVLNEVKRYLGDVWIPLEKASGEERRSFVDALLDTEPNRFDESFRKALHHHTQGHPLFVVELLHNLQERSDIVKDSEDRWITGPRLDWSVLPSRVEGVIEERFGRLEQEQREILTVASVEGESFTAQVIARVQRIKEREILRLLSVQLEKRHRLVQEGSTEKVGSNWLSRFAFAHNLFQQYLYRELGERERMLLHEEIAELLEELYSGQTEAAVQLARHYDLGGMPEKAIHYMFESAARALRLSAYVEARALLDRALEILPELPAGPERDGLELAIRLRRIIILNAREGWVSPALVGEYYRARELCHALGERQQLSRLLYGLYSYHLVKVELDQAFALAQEQFALAEELRDPNARMQSRTAMGNILFWMGRFVDSVRYTRQSLELFDPASRAEHILQYGQDSRLFPLMFTAYGCWVLGDVDGALEAKREIVRLAEDSSHPFSQTIAARIAGYLEYLMRDPAAALDWAERGVRLAEAHSFPYYLGLAITLRGWANAVQGKAEEGADEIRRGFATGGVLGGRINHPIYCLMLAEAQALAGRNEEALATVEEGLEATLACRELCCESELCRVKAELLSSGPEAEPLFLRALEVSRAQGARLFELRAAVSLARFWSRNGRNEEAHALLAPVYAAFTSGYDTVDVREAGAVLQELDQRSG